MDALYEENISAARWQAHDDGGTQSTESKEERRLLWILDHSKPPSELSRLFLESKARYGLANTCTNTLSTKMA